MTLSRQGSAGIATFGWLVVAVVALLAGGRLAMSQGWIRAPYPDAGREVAWAFGVPAAAYNFSEVVPGRLFRSSEPDRRFLEWLQREHGVSRVVGLNGATDVHADARELGMEVSTYQWYAPRLPPWDELESVAGLLDEGEPVLVHCASGSDRTGYAIAAYRVLQQGWALQDAVQEMREFWHDPARHPKLHRELATRFEANP